MANHLKKLIKSNILILLLFYIFSCVTADKSKSEIIVNKNKVLSSTLINQIYNFHGLNINLIIIDESEGFFSDLFNSIAVDKQESAFYYLLKNYYISYISVENTTNHELVFNANSICIVVDDFELKPIMKENLPDKLERFNLKGTIKNIYNTGAICATTAFIVLSIITCAKDNHCGGIEHIDDVLNLSQTGETDPKKLFSSIVHKTEIQYNDVIDKENIIGPGQIIDGIIFFEKEKKILDSIVQIFYNQHKKK